MSTRNCYSKRNQWLVIGTMMLAVIGWTGVQPAAAQSTTKKQVRQKDQPDSREHRTTRRPPQPYDSRRGHRDESRDQRESPHRRLNNVHVRRPRRLDNGRLDARRLLSRSAIVANAILNRFQARRQEQLHRVIHEFRQGQREQAIRLWATFLNDLADDDEPIELDDVLLLVAREGCGAQNQEMRIRAARLDYVRDSLDRAEEQLSFLEDQRNNCKSSQAHCNFDTIKDIETQIIRTRADRDIWVVEERLADQRMNQSLQASQAYENQFATTMDDLYREVELRVRISR